MLTGFGKSSFIMVSCWNIEDIDSLIPHINNFIFDMIAINFDMLV